MNLNRRTLTAFAAAATLALNATATLAAPGDEAAIRQTLQRYEQALNRADTAAIVGLYTADGVQMAPDAPAAVGATGVRAAYDATFKAITLKLAFTVDEIQLLGPDAALLRSHSSGTLKVNGSDQSAGPAAFKELFVLRRGGGGEWKFSHYSFSGAPAATK